MKAHRYFLEKWVLTFAGGADIEDRSPKSNGNRVVSEFMGYNQIAIRREVNALVRYINIVGGVRPFVAEQSVRADTYGKIVAGVDPTEFVRYRLRLLLYFCHKTGARSSKKKLRQLLGHTGRYEFPFLVRRLDILDSTPALSSRPSKVETIEEYLCRGGKIRSLKIRRSPRKPRAKRIVSAPETSAVILHHDEIKNAA